MRNVIGVLLLGHAVAHLPGFLVNMRLRSFPELPFRTTVLNGSFDVGERAVKVFGLAWLMVAVALMAAAIAAFMRVSWWQTLAYWTLALSMAACLLGWPDTRIGMLASVVILVIILVGARSQWL